MDCFSDSRVANFSRFSAILTASTASSPEETFDVGENSATPVGPYQSAFPFMGVLEKLELRSEAARSLMLPNERQKRRLCKASLPRRIENATWNQTRNNIRPKKKFFKNSPKNACQAPKRPKSLK
jgi:hypothetical protein